jgi:uncharacterized protein (TIGR02996 family)
MRPDELSVELGVLRDAVTANPADDTVRLAYADLLDEAAADHVEIDHETPVTLQARASLIRTTIEYARLPDIRALPCYCYGRDVSYCPYCRETKARSSLYQRLRNALEAPPAGTQFRCYGMNLDCRYPYRRGFLHTLSLHAEPFFQLVDDREVFLLHPIRFLDLSSSYQPYQTESGEYLWGHSGTGIGGQSRYLLPTPLFEAVVTQRPTPRYATSGDAYADLSRAAVVWAYAQVGVPLPKGVN